MSKKKRIAYWSPELSEKAVEFTAGENSKLKTQAEKERKAWNLFYDILDQIEQSLIRKESAAINIMNKANEIVKNCQIKL